MTRAPRPIELGILDLGPPAATIEMAPIAERLGYTRYWLGEHHGQGASSGSPDLMTALVAGLTRRMRVGPAGVILHYRSPLKVAEDFRLLSFFFPGRIDLGLARGVAEPAVVAALLDGRPGLPAPEEHARRVADVCGLLHGRLPDGHPLKHVPLPPPGEIDAPQIWVLGASAASARVAARLGVAFCVAEHLSTPDAAGAVAVRFYVDGFVPGPGLRSPRFSVCAAGTCAATERAARRSLAGLPGFFRTTWVGSPRRCRDELLALCDRYATREAIVCDLARTPAATRRSYELLAAALGLGAPSARRRQGR